jgi:hypothetical protein
MTVIGNVADAPRLLLTVMVPGFVSLISPDDHQDLELRSHADLPSVQAVPQGRRNGSLASITDQRPEWFTVAAEFTRRNCYLTFSIPARCAAPSLVSSRSRNGGLLNFAGHS